LQLMSFSFWLFVCKSVAAAAPMKCST
jgi:hypothetical protein